MDTGTEQKSPGSPHADKAIEELRKISPLALPGYIAECEFYDQTESRKIFDDAVREFEKDGGTADSILKPVIWSVADGLLEAIPGGAALRRKGLTPQRIYNECTTFSYGQDDGAIGTIPGVAYVDYLNARGVREGELSGYRLPSGNEKRRGAGPLVGDCRGGFAQHSQRQYKGHRDNYEDKAALDAYKAEYARTGGKTLVDEYTGRRDVWLYEKNPDGRRRLSLADSRSHVANVDHIVPLASIQRSLAGNYALSRADIKAIANAKYNFAITNAKLNKMKGDLSNREFVKRHPELDERTKRIMLQKEEAALKAIEDATNEKVSANLLDGGRKGSVIRKRLAGQATDQAANYAIGNVVLYLLKPLYWELKDSFKNGIQEGVNASSGAEALRIRFGRVKNYLLAHAKEFLGDSVWEFVKGFISALIEGIVGLFVGMFRSVLKLLKEGVRIFVQAAKILWGKNSSKMSPAEKGDAIVKLIGASVASLAGVGVDMVLASIGVPRILYVPLSAMLSGIAAALFMYLLDRADLFSVKAERRYARLKEIFDARIADMKADTARFNTAVTEQLRQNRLEFAQFERDVQSALDGHDSGKLDQAMVQMARYLQISLPYEDARSFVSFVKSRSCIRIDETTVDVA